MFVYRRPVDSRCELRRTDHGSLCGMNSIFIFCRFGGCMISEVNVRWNMRRFSDLKLSRWWGSPWERSIRFPNSCWASCWSRTAILYPEGCRWGQEIWFGRWHHTCRHRKRCRPSKIEECEVYELRWTDGIVVHYWVKPLNSHISDLKCVGGQENREAPVFLFPSVFLLRKRDCWKRCCFFGQTLDVPILDPFLLARHQGKLRCISWLESRCVWETKPSIHDMNRSIKESWHIRGETLERDMNEVTLIQRL